MNLGGVLKEISVDLNDHEPGYEYTRWSVEQLRTFAAEALTLLGDSFEYLYMVVGVIPIKAGGGWQPACNCDNLMRIIAETDSEGDVKHYLTRSVDADFNTWTGPIQNRCRKNPEEYHIGSYTINAADKSLFKVDPPMPVGIRRYVLAECYKRPTGALAEAVPEEIIPLVKQWVMYRALSIDSENNPVIVDLAKSHRDTFVSLFENAKARRKEQEDGSAVRTVQKQAAQ